MTETMKEAPDAQAQACVEVDPQASMGAGIADETAEETADLFGEGREETAQTQGAKRFFKPTTTTSPRKKPRKRLRLRHRIRKATEKRT